MTACSCKTCEKIRERIARLKMHSGSGGFCGPCSSGSRGQDCAFGDAELQRDIRELEELLQ